MPTEGPFWVYILENAVGRFYIGSSDDVSRRLAEHHQLGFGKAKFTHKHGPWALVWSEPHPDRPSAVRRERQIKSMKSAKWIREELLNCKFPTRRD